MFSQSPLAGFAQEIIGNGKVCMDRGHLSPDIQFRRGRDVVSKAA
jgi:hypothetical protein